MKDTTTGNVYGVFDMAGASSEYVVGNVEYEHSCCDFEAKEIGE